MAKKYVLTLGVLTFLAAHSVFGTTHFLPTSVIGEALSETVPTAFSPDDFSTDDFIIEWIGKPLNGVNYELRKGSLEWVRVAEVLVVPRAQILISIDNVDGGHVSNTGFFQPFLIDHDRAKVELPIALISGESNAIKLSVLRNGSEEKGTLIVRFKPKKVSEQPRIYADHSCSGFKLSFDFKGTPELWNNHWLYLGCRLVHGVTADSHNASLEVFVLWDNVGEVIELQGVSTKSSSTSLWPLRLRSSSRPVTVRAGQKELDIYYRTPKKVNLGFIGVGIGPYAYTFDAPGANVDKIAPVMTLYGGYFIFETMRIVAFNASVLDSTLNSDLGLYLNSESIRAFDRRVSINLMLGGHVQGYRNGTRNNWTFGAPQGVELIVRDVIKKGRNAAAGAFIYPAIQKKSYYNVWLRWGSSVFGEFNYMAWQEPLGENRAYSRSVGLSFGFPLVRFL